MSNITAKNFILRLLEIFEKLEEQEFDITDYSAQVIRSFLNFGSETPDNRAAALLIEYGNAASTSHPNATINGLKVKGKPIFVSHILNELEMMGIPDIVRDVYPDLTEDEWSAVLRVATVVLAALSPLHLNKEV